MKSFLKGFLKAILIIVIICIIGFVIIAVVALRAPGKAVEKLEDKIVEIEETQEEITEEIQEELPSEESKEETQAPSEDGIRPEFKKSMESYEAFFDEYVEFMNAYAKDPTNLPLLGKYASIMSKYEKYMNELSSIDETQLSKEEDKLFIETQLRISNKLANVAIDIAG